MRSALLEELRSGSVTVGERLPTESELAQRLKASRSTVVRALRELKAEGLITGRRGSGNYVTRTPATTPALFGVLSDVAPGEANRNLSELMVQLSLALQAENKGLLIHSAGAHEDGTLEAAQLLIDQGVGGVFIVPPEWGGDTTELNRRLCDLLREAGLPVVLMDRDIVAPPRRSGYDLITANHRETGYLATQMLIDGGGERIGFLGVAHSPSVAERRLGYTDALQQAGREVEHEWQLNVDDDFDPEAVWRRCQELKLDSLACKSDRYAARLLARLNENGVAVPGRLQMAGMGDEPFSAMLPVPLSSVAFSVSDLAAAAVQTMNHRLAHPDAPARRVEVASVPKPRRTTRPAC